MSKTMSKTWQSTIENCTKHLNEVYDKHGRKVTLENFEVVEAALLKVADDLSAQALNIIQLRNALRNSQNDHTGASKYTLPYLNTFESLLNSVGSKIKALREDRSRLVEGNTTGDSCTVLVLDADRPITCYDVGLTMMEAVDMMTDMTRQKGVTLAQIKTQLGSSPLTLSERTAFNSFAIRNTVVVDFDGGVIFYTDTDGNEHEVQI